MSFSCSTTTWQFSITTTPLPRPARKGRAASKAAQEKISEVVKEQSNLGSKKRRPDAETTKEEAVVRSVIALAALARSNLGICSEKPARGGKRKVAETVVEEVVAPKRATRARK